MTKHIFTFQVTVLAEGLAFY